jgi:hypothetical protein
MPEPEYVLVGYFRFIESDKPGVVGEVISTFKEGWAADSDVPVYRILGETKATRLIDGGES